MAGKKGSSAGSRALPDLVSRVRVDASGIDAAMLSMVTSFEKASLKMAAAAAGIGLIIIGAKSAMEIAEQNEKAERSLSQAVESHNTQLKDQTHKSADLAKAQKELTKAKRELYEYDLAHHATADKTSQDLKGHEADLKKVTEASKRLQAAQSALEQWDLSHTGHVLSAAQLRQREQRLRDVAEAQGTLAKAQGKAATIDSVTSRGQQMSALELAKREDILNNVAEAQANLNAETTAANTGAKAQKLSFEQVRGSADKLIASNQQYTADQTGMYEGYAKLIRGGLDLTETERVMNDAIDLAAIKHISLSEAVDVLNNAEHGRMRGLIDLGISTKELTDESGNLLGGQRAISAAMKEVDARVKGGRDTLTETEQASNRLSNSWQNIAGKVGPPLLGLFSFIVEKLSDAVNWLDQLGHNKAWNEVLYAAFGLLQNKIVDIVQGIEKLVEGIKWLIEHGAQLARFLGIDIPGPPAHSSFDTGHAAGERRAAGGPVVPGSVYTVGEEGEETLVMGARGGYVIPHGGSGRGRGTINITVNAQTNADPRDIATEIGWELRKLRRAW